MKNIIFDVQFNNGNFTIKYSQSIKEIDENDILIMRSRLAPAHVNLNEFYTKKEIQFWQKKVMRKEFYCFEFPMPQKIQDTSTLRTMIILLDPFEIPLCIICLEEVEENQYKVNNYAPFDFDSIYRPIFFKYHTTLKEEESKKDCESYLKEYVQAVLNNKISMVTWLQTHIKIYHARCIIKKQWEENGSSTLKLSQYLDSSFEYIKELRESNFYDNLVFQYFKKDLNEKEIKLFLDENKTNPVEALSKKLRIEYSTAQKCIDMRKVANYA